MPRIAAQQAYPRFLKEARNSSQFVWFAAGLEFFESSRDGWIFAYARRKDVLLVALEPLIPGAPAEYGPAESEAFDRAWAELVSELKPSVTAFVAVYDPFQRLLASKGFQSLKIGEEPWVELSDFFPTGNSGKGVRAARNQAIHAGVKVEEWQGRDIAADPSKQATLLELLESWKSKRTLQLTGFLNTTDPLLHASDRRYFVARSSGGEPEGYLVATPIAAANGTFLEDMILRPGAPRGSGELLTVEALSALAARGGSASLGVVSVTRIDESCGSGLPRKTALLTLKLPRLLRKLYNFNGLETFRKRFKIRSWESIHLCVRNESAGKLSDEKAWLRALVALGAAFRPRIRISFARIRTALSAAWERHPLSWAVAAVSLALFGAINRFGDLPYAALRNLGFSAEAPLPQWFYRTVTSDFLYFDCYHFWCWATALVIAIRWAEGCHRRGFLLKLFAFSSFLDDFINYGAIIGPFHFLKPELYSRLIRHHDVGGSLILAVFLGLQLCQIRKYREILFAVLIVGLVFGYVFSSLQFHTLVLNLNHFLFVCIGYVIGKLKFDREKRRDQQASRNKPPQPLAPKPAKAA